MGKSQLLSCTSTYVHTTPKQILIEVQFYQSVGGKEEEEGEKKNLVAVNLVCEEYAEVSQYSLHSLPLR